MTLIGPNGSGKSTILKSITRQLKLIGGKANLDQNDIGSMSYREPFHENGGGPDGAHEAGADDLS